MSQSKTTRRRSPEANTLSRQASIKPSSFDPKNNTFTAVISTGASVKRRDPYDGSSYFETLSVTPASVRLDRARAGVVPLLNSHRSGDLSDQIGVVTAVRFEEGQLVADIRLSPSDDGKAIARAIEAGTPPNVSIGYQIHGLTEGNAARGSTPTHTVIDWELLEVSLVAIPADPQTYIRNLKGNPMDENETIDTIDDRRSEDENESRTSENIRAMSDRHAREAYGIAARANLPAEFARQHIDRGVTLAAFRTIVFDRLAADADRTRTSNLAPQFSHETFDNPEFLSRSIEDALYSRMSGKPAQGPSAELVGRSMLDLGVMLLQSRGERVSWSNRSALAGRIMERGVVGAHTTDDFPILLTSAGNRVLQDAYQSAETPLKSLARRRNVSDFRAVSTVKLSEAPRLLKVNESGEITHGSRSEAKEGFHVETFARIFSISRNAIVNDDLGAFADSNVAWGRAAAETEADLLVKLLTDNTGNGAKLDDGNPLYGTARGNKVGTGTAISVAALAPARQALREMKGLDGKTPINVVPKHLVVGPAKETEAEQVLATIAAAQVDDTNPFSGKLTLHVEPRLSGNAWRLFADPSQVACLVIGYLNGEAGPRLDIREGWNTLGAEFRAVLDFGCAVQDWRGTYLNPGN